MNRSPQYLDPTGRLVRHRDDHPSTLLFGRIFAVVVALSTLCLLLNTVLALALPEPSPQVQDLISTLATAWKMGFGAIVGLLGGMATR